MFVDSLFFKSENHWTKNCSLAEISGPYGVTKYVSGWRKDVVNQCLEFDSEHRVPAPSSKLCQIWLRHWRGTLYLHAAVHRRGQHPPKGLGTDKTVEAT